MSLHDAGQLPATPPTHPTVQPSGSTHDAKATSTSEAASEAAENWNSGADTVLAIDATPAGNSSDSTVQHTAAGNAAQKMATTSSHWECPAPCTTGANMISAHSAVTAIYAGGSSLLSYITVEATKACLATQDSNSSAANIHRTNAIACGIGAACLLACSVAWGLKYMKPSIEQWMVRRHD